jgi:hypothetical protein
MTRLSDDKFSSPVGSLGGRKFTPFTAFVRIVPLASNKRFEVVRDMQELANVVEDRLASLSEPDANGEVFLDAANPVKFTPQFGDKTARLTIHGNMKSDAGMNTFSGNDDGFKQHVEDRLIIHDGQYKTGYGGNNAATRVESSGLDNSVLELIFVFDSIGIEAYRIEAAGVIYGDGGRHFPRA